MEPISAAMAEPMRPAIRIAIMTGASSLQTDRPTRPPIALESPRSASTGPVWRAITPPMKRERMQAMSRLALPISKSWSKTLRRWRTTAGSALRVRQNKTIISPMF